MEGGGWVSLSPVRPTVIMPGASQRSAERRVRRISLTSGPAEGQARGVLRWAGVLYRFNRFRIF